MKITRKMKKTAFLLSVLMVFSMLIPFLKGEKVLAATTLDVYPYGSDMDTGDVTLNLPVTGSSYQWQQADSETGDWSNVEGETNSTYVLDEDTLPNVDLKWFRCLVDSKPTKAVQILDAENNNFTENNMFDYYIGNGCMAYAVADEYFDVVGKYEKEGNVKWMQTSYDSYWSMNTSSNTESDYDESDADITEMIISFDGYKVTFNAKLGASADGLCISADTQLGDGSTSGDYDDCAALSAILNSRQKLIAIDMVGAESFSNLTGNEPALVIKPETLASKFWIGEYSTNKLYDYNNINGMHIFEAMEIVWSRTYDGVTNWFSYFIGEGYNNYTPFETKEQAINATIDKLYEDATEQGTECSSKEKAALIYLSACYDNTAYAEMESLEEAFEYFCNTTYKIKEFDGKKIVTQVEGTDSGLNISWCDKHPGDIVSFSFMVGTVRDTNADEIANLDGEDVSAGAGDAVHVHEFGPYVSDNNASTQSNGTETAKCKGCDETKVREIPNSKINVEVEKKEEAKEVVGQGEIKAEVNKDKEVPIVDVSGMTIDLAKKLLTSEEIAAVEAGAKALIYLDVTKLDDRVTTTDKEKTEKFIKTLDPNAKVGMYLDLSLFKKLDTEEKATRLTDMKSEKITVSIEVPQDLVGNLKAEQTFGIIRIHDGVVEEIEATYDKNTMKITFATDRFSTYAIIYKDANVDVPQTGDSTDVIKFAVIMMVAVGCTLGMCILKKRNEE